MPLCTIFVLIFQGLEAKNFPRIGGKDTQALTGIMAARFLIYARARELTRI
jgi:hypothetical protein